MPISFTCPFCGAVTNVADQYAGQTGPCAKCGQTITIPGTPVESPISAPAPPRKSPSTTLVVVFVVLGGGFMLLVCGGILVALLLPAVQAAREAARRAQCMNNMKQVTLALHNYESEYGQFPPAYVADKDGKPMYSWRVLILPYLEQQDLYERYHLDEPWDSPANRAVTQVPISSFQCASSPPGRTGFPNGAPTNYVMVVGPGCVSEGPTSHKISDISDGTANTILLAEVAGSDIAWAEPRDLDAQTMSYVIDDPSGRPCISSNHPGVVNVAMADGSVHRLDNDTDPETVRQMTQIADDAPDMIPY
ncbi:MAG: DUF1559 domain-containing protein [Pirellulales bacterium]|nr:DUF1559 domain-containing protein [Pirellulales bacterium]